MAGAAVDQQRQPRGNRSGNNPTLNGLLNSRFASEWDECFPEPIGNRSAPFRFSGRWRQFLYGGGSFRPRPAIACCGHAGRDTSRREQTESRRGQDASRRKEALLVTALLILTPKREKGATVLGLQALILRRLPAGHECRATRFRSKLRWAGTGSPRWAI